MLLGAFIGGGALPAAAGLQPGVDASRSYWHGVGAGCMMALVRLRIGGPDIRTQAQVGTLIAGTLVFLAVGLVRMSNEGSVAGDGLEASSSQRTAVNGDEHRDKISPSQPALPVSFTRAGEIIRPAPVRARIIDPETGEEVLVYLPPGSTVVDGEVVPIGSTGTSSAGGIATTSPGMGTTGTTDGGLPTTQPPTTQPPTTQPPTTEPPTTEPPTTEPPTTETPTTEPPTTEPPTTEPPQGLGGLLGEAVDLLGG